MKTAVVGVPCGIEGSMVNEFVEALGPKISSTKLLVCIVPHLGQIFARSMHRVISHFNMASQLSICLPCSCYSLRYLLQGRWVLIPTQKLWPNSPSPETGPEITSIRIHRYHNLVRMDTQDMAKQPAQQPVVSNSFLMFLYTPCIRCCLYWTRGRLPTLECMEKSF